MDTVAAVLGRVLASKRKQAGLTQEALAYQCKLHPTYVSQLERGLKSLTVRVLTLVAGAVGVRASEILREAEELVQS